MSTLLARVQPEARPAGEAQYAIVDHDGHRPDELPPEPLERGSLR